MVKGRTVRMTSAQEGLALCVRTVANQLAQWIVVPGGNIQILCHQPVIEIRKIAHEVMHDVAPRRQLVQDLDLQAIEACDLRGGKAPERQTMRRAGLGHGGYRKSDLLETRVLHAPEHIAPGRVERIDGRVALLTPALEGTESVGRVAQCGVVTAILVVGLPGNQPGVRSETLGERGHDACTLRAIGGRREAVVPTRAELADLALLVAGKDVRMALQQPARRRCGGRSQDHRQTGCMQRVDRLFEPVEAVVAGRRFEPAPGELTDAHHRQADRAHRLRILLPARWRPVFRVVADAGPHRWPPSPSDDHWSMSI